MRSPATWERLAPLPVSNGGCVAVALGGEIVVAGGTTWSAGTKTWLDAIWAYDRARDVWKDAGRLPAPLAYAVAGHDAHAVWFAGGSSGTTTHRSLWRMDEALSPKLVAPLDRGAVYAAGARIGSALHVVGGTDDQAALERVGNAFVAIDVDTGDVTELPPYPEAGLTTATAAAVRDRLFVFGGAAWDPVRGHVVNHATAHAYSVTEKRWDALPPLPHAGRGFSAIPLDDRHVLVAGGYRDDEVGFVADALVFDVQAGRYAETTPLPYPAMVGLVRADEWLYCLGGEDRKKHRTDAVHRIRWSTLL